MPRILVRAVGNVETGILASVETAIARAYSAGVDRLEPIADPPGAFDPRRNQHSSVTVLKHLMASAPEGDSKVLGVTERDLFIPMLTFVFGQAQLDGRFAVVSLARLRQEFYGLPSNAAVLEQRAIKEASHELGHTFGLAHCADSGCPMSLSTSIRQVDAKSDLLCPECTAALRSRGAALKEQSI